MNLQRFLSSLMESGQAHLGDGPEADAPALLEFDRRARLESPLAPPALSLPAARWGASMLFAGCRLLLRRDLDASVVTRTLAAPCPESPSPSVAYSADLTLRYLPDLWTFARRLADDDSLVGAVASLAASWPLSSVGIPGLAAPAIDAFWDHPSLRVLYLDRIVLRRDFSRLADARVRAVAREALGAHPELCPPLAEALAS